MLKFTGDYWAEKSIDGNTSIYAGSQQIANVKGKVNASLIASAPDMYRLIYKLANSNELNPTIMKLLVKQAEQLLNYMERKEVNS